MNKNESKYFNTAVKMDQALISLLEKKDFDYITIKEICHAAGVNRSTFYLHYENTADLLKEATRYILDRFLSYFPVDAKIVTQRFEDCDLKELVFISPEYLTPYLTFVRDNRRVFKTALKHFGTLGFEDVYDRMFKYLFVPILTRFHYSEKEQTYVMKFYLSGVTAVVMEWVGRNCEDDMDIVTQIIIDCIFGKQNKND